ncbi:hypothetical protein Dvar_55150 [Desulfosarcina variabilis str. Montpellier]
MAQESAPIRAATLDCQAGGVDQVVCEVYDAEGNWLVIGGPWDCEAGSGRVEGIPPGQDRIFVVLAEDEFGNIRYQGETTGVSIEAGEITQGVVIDAYLFVPTLSAPEDDAEDIDPNSVSLEWETVENADEYLVQVATDLDFEAIVINETTPATAYAPSTLEPLTEYFWKICAVDMYTNTGADSEVRSFVTSDCAYTISPASRSVTWGGETYAVAVTATHTECEWSTSESYDWILLSPTSGSGSDTVQVTVSANEGEARSATITIAGQDHTINQDPAGCSYTISPASRSVDNEGETYNVAVTATHSECEWSTSENYDWILLSPASGSGNGTVSVTVLANTGAARSATITIAGQNHTINQDPAGCSYTISPTIRSVNYEGEAYTVTVTATHSECDWSASENYNWISLTPTSGNGNGTVSVTVSANTGAARSATITIAGQNHTINQDPAGCSYTISPTSRSVDNEGETYSVTVTATHSGCDWSASENDDWISLSPTSGSGSGTVRVTVSANTGAARSATITIAGRPHTVNQAAGSCTYTIAPTSRSVDNEGETYSVTVTATHSGCDWSTSENYNWISLSPTSGSGSGTVRVTVSANTGAARSATITIAGRPHTVNQAAGSCTYTIAPTSRSVDNEGETYSVTVTATHSGCDWSTSENYTWISLSPTSGSGSGTVRVTVSANTGAARSATITIAGQNHTINQDPGGCSYTIAPTSRSVDDEGETYSVTVTATHSGCDWSTSENYTWISLSPTNGSGSGTVRVTVSANTGAARSATITIAGQNHTINQDPGGCSYTIAPTSRSVENDGETYSVTVTATHSGCDWSTSEDYGWISLSPTSGSGSGTVRVTVSANTGAARSATITIAGQNHTINQDPGGCTYTIAPTSRSVENDGEAYNVTVTATHSECEWSTSENYNWISLSPTSGSGSGTVRVTVSANDGAARSATITIAGQNHTINQEAGACTYTISPTSRSVDDEGETYSVTVTATHSGCDWSTSENYTWISLSPTSGSGSGTVRVTVSANTGAARSATITIAGQNHTINQDPGDTAAPTPNPLTWSTEPYETSTSSISMTSNSASDPTTPITYLFDFYNSPSGGSGGTDSSWQSNRSYTDSGLGTNHQYGYRVRARDGLNNQTSWSDVSYDYTDIETPTGITFGTITTNSIQARSTNTPSGLTRGSSGLILYNTTRATNSGWRQNNDYWNSTSLSVNTSYGFRARARNGDGDLTDYSTTYTRYTLANTPGYAQFSNVTQTSIRANWTANGNPSGTQYYCENMDNGTNSGWITNTYWASTGLDCGASYEFRVRARNGNNVVTGWRYLDNQYTLGCDDIYEENDTMGSAHNITSWGTYWLYGIQYDYDWYVFYYDGSGEYLEVLLDFSHSNGDIDLALYNSSGALIASSTSSTDDEQIVVSVGAGTYYIRVSGYPSNNTGNTYYFRWRWIIG